MGSTVAGIGRWYTADILVHVSRTPWAAVVVVALAAVTRDARADDVRLAGFHLAYSIGGGPSSLGIFRQGLDLGVTAGTQSTTGSSIGMWDRHQGMLFGVSGVVGFHVYPSYVIGEIGWGEDTTLAGWGWLVGPVLRVDPVAGGGAGGRIAFTLLIFEAGVRLIAIAAPSPEVQAALTLGIGYY
jgi:hypothetical protein